MSGTGGAGSKFRMWIRRACKPVVAVGFPLLLVVGIWYLLRFSPEDPEAFYLPCIFRSLTGWYCPTCGATRSVHALLHGDWLAALRYNLLLPGMAALVTWFFFGLYLWFVTGKNRLRLPVNFRLWWMWTTLSVIVVYAILRNLPFAPFVWLAPTG